MSYLLTICFIIATNVALTQVRNKPYAIYATAGVKMGIGASSINNTNMSYDKKVQYKSGFQSSFGLKTSANYISKTSINSIYGIHFDLLWNRFPIEMTHINTDSRSYQKNVSLNSSNYTFTLRYMNTRIKWHVEGGIQFSQFMKIKQDNSGVDSLFYAITSDYIYKNNYKKYSSIVIGTGFYIKGVVASIRVTSSLSSLTNTNTSPVKDGYFNNSDINKSYINNYKTDAETSQNTFIVCIEYYIPVIKFKRDTRGKTKFSFKPIDTSYYWGDDNPYK